MSIPNAGCPVTAVAEVLPYVVVFRVRFSRQSTRRGLAEDVSTDLKIEVGSKYLGGVVCKAAVGGELAS